MKNLIVLDIGTQFIKALIMEIDKKSGKGIVRAWAKEEFSNDKAAVCQKIFKNLEKKSGTKTQEIFLGLGSDVLKGRAATFCFKRDNPAQKVDLAELKYLIQKVLWRALDRIRKEIVRETEFKDTDARLLDAFIVDIEVDGHSVSDPISSQGQNICLSIFNIYTSEKWLDGIRSFVSALGFKLLGLIPVSYALFHCLNLEKSVKGSALIIDVGAKTTEVTLVKNGGEEIETKNFHLGGQAFSRVLAEFLGLNLAEAEIIKIKYSRGEISKEVKKKIEKLFAPNVSSWLKGIKIILEDFIKEYKFLPAKVFLCGGGCGLPVIESALKKEKKFKISYIEKTPISSLAELYADSLKEKDIFQLIFKRAIKLIQG